MSLDLNATDISVRQVLSKLDGEFASTVRALENGEFTLWIGSGISRKAPNLGDLIESALEYLRARAVDPATKADYMPALEEALELAGKDCALISADLCQPVSAWTLKDEIVNALWNTYSRVLDIRIPGRPSDCMLWEAVDIRARFADPAPPAAEHLCIAMLVIEGVVHTIASGNWDGFIEAAIDRLGGGISGLLQVVVDPSHLRGPAGKAKLLKFHGCILHATAEPGMFRRYLTGSSTQILEWPEEPQFSAMRNAVVDVATNQKAMVLGLSIQDVNLQSVFSKAKQINPWPWPCVPLAPGHIFCEDKIKQGQRDVLRIVYGHAYNSNAPAIHQASHMRSWAEQVLAALVLKVVTDKLALLMEQTLTAAGKLAMASALTTSLNNIRNSVADAAICDSVDKSRTSAVNRGIGIWSRLVSVFRTGALPRNPSAYEAVSPSAPHMLRADPNAQAAGLGRLGIALSLLEHGRAAGRWTLSQPLDAELTSGVAAASPARTGAIIRPVFLVRSASEAIRLQSDGAFANENGVVIHSDDVWHMMAGGGLSGNARQPRRAPGRTGVVETRHVSLGNLLQRTSSVDSLRDEFAAEMML